MSKIIIEQLGNARNEANRKTVEKRYLINNEILKGEVDASAVEPLTILESILIKKEQRKKS